KGAKRMVYSYIGGGDGGGFLVFFDWTSNKCYWCYIWFGWGGFHQTNSRLFWTLSDYNNRSSFVNVCLYNVSRFFMDKTTGVKNNGSSSNSITCWWGSDRRIIGERYFHDIISL